MVAVKLASVALANIESNSIDYSSSEFDMQQICRHKIALLQSVSDALDIQQTVYLSSVDLAGPSDSVSVGIGLEHPSGTFVLDE